MPWKLQDSPTVLERVVAVLCYLTSGLAGIVYIIISRSSYQSNFFRFHFLQSIILGILTILLTWTGNAFQMFSLPLFEILNSAIPNTGGMIANVIAQLIMAVPVAFGLLSIYGLVLAALGKYAEIPFVSDLVRQQIR